jgi:hypothetical protein
MNQDKIVVRPFGKRGKAYLMDRRAYLSTVKINCVLSLLALAALFAPDLGAPLGLEKHDVYNGVILLCALGAAVSLAPALRGRKISAREALQYGDEKSSGVPDFRALLAANKELFGCCAVFLWFGHFASLIAVDFASQCVSWAGSLAGSFCLYRYITQRRSHGAPLRRSEIVVFLCGAWAVAALFGAMAG